MDTNFLEEAGLTKGEAKVYLSLLKLGETTTGRIIEEAAISSGKVYEILDKLIKKGLVSYNIKERTKYFVASSPNRILVYLQEKEKNLERVQQEVVKKLPLLLSVENEGGKPHEAHIFKGIRGIQTAIFEALEELREREEVLAMGVTSYKKEQYNFLWESWHKKRVAKKVNCKMLFSDKNTDYFRTFRGMKFTEVKILEGITPSAIDIMGDYVLIFTYGEEPSCLSIKNPGISTSFRSFFETLWSVASA